ncbi:toxin-antitoxin system HicB family antitoxin [Amycolatopsis regifaucium]|uniref:Histidine kinase n=1 Tax=Amycolatopsis regifaucium TaxID=546365 RepID=A0A154MEJ8_9PSEU|nr:toxin-antitoxin system HicB family antitoxin [Amycolatopsis regifaucium]KZB82974.1 histidine kinase [Amycolatopsis regifaucium]SFH44012.1 HicB family protein [Amycolatopsis regifaucium]
MDLTPFVDNVRRELAIAAEAGGAEASALAERLTAPLASAIRLALMDALSAASDEITRDLAPGSVEVRLRAGEVGFAVTPPTVEPAGPVAASTPEPPVASPSDEEGATARINFRLPEHLKARVEEAAAAQGRSVNAWLVRAASAALQPADRPAASTPPSGGRRAAQRYTGWVS